MRAVKLSRAHLSSCLLLHGHACLSKPNPNPNNANEAFSVQKATETLRLLLHRSYSLTSNPHPDVRKGADQKGFEKPSDYDFDRPAEVPCRNELLGRAELLGTLGQEVSLSHSGSGSPMARSVLELCESGMSIILDFLGDPALIAAAYLVKGDCILVSGKLFCSYVEAAAVWGVQVADLKYVQTEHHNGRIPTGFVREPRMEKLAEEGLHATWREFFSDPSQWWDNRAKQGNNSRLPDFTHKTLGYGLRVRDCPVPFWVTERLRHFDASLNGQLSDVDRNARREDATSWQQHGYEWASTTKE